MSDEMDEKETEIKRKRLSFSIMLPCDPLLRHVSVIIPYELLSRMQRMNKQVPHNPTRLLKNRTCVLSSAMIQAK